MCSVQRERERKETVMKALVLCAFAALLACPARAMLAGGMEQVDSTTTEVANAAQFAIQQINAQSNNMFAMLLSSVTEASSQVVAGTKYTLVVEAVQSSDCRNDGQPHTLCSCSADQNKQVGYKVEVLVQPWMTPSMQLLSFKDVALESTNSVDAVSKTKPLSIGSAISSTTSEFQQFLKTYTPSYCINAAELTKRSEVFQNNMRRIKKIQQTEKGSARYGATRFADLTEDEFLAQYAMPQGVLKPDATMKQAPPMKTDSTPTSFDWRDHGVVTPVKNQGSCGSCWAFSTTGNIEGQWAIKKGKLVALSEQELVDCDKVDHGCQGGLPSQAYKQIISLGGLTGEATYPYTGRDGTCHFSRSEAIVNINGSLALSTDEAQMAAWLAANGPISIGINASPMQFYIGGISHPFKIFCNPEHLDHGVLIVGYGVKGSEPYWIIKNSWGATWGEKGYYLVYRGDGVCGLNRMPTSSIVD